MSKVRRNDHSRSMISVYVMRATSLKRKNISIGQIVIVCCVTCVISFVVATADMT